MEAVATAWFLAIRDPDGSQRRLPLEEDVVRIGRAQDAHVRLDAVAVSRFHAELFRAPDGNWRVRDLDSRNGTAVNGAAVRERVLGPGDRVQVGGFELTVVAPEPATPPPFQRSAHPSVMLIEDDGRLETLNDLERPRVAAEHLDKLNDFSRSLLLMTDPNARQGELCRLLTDGQFGGDRSLLLRVSRAEPERAPQILCDRASPRAHRATAGEPYVSRSLLRAVIARGEAVLASNVRATAASVAMADVQMSIDTSVMVVAAVACPVRTTASEVDVLYMTLPPQYGTAEWLALASLAVKQFQLAEQAWEARARAAATAAFERELERAAQIQQRLLPDPARLAALRAAGVDVAVGFNPCRLVGGDYVDAIRTADGRVLIVTADVCGHGLAAALVSTAVHTLVHAAARAGNDLLTMADAINRHLCESLGGDTFVTFAAISLDPATGIMRVVNAGHPPPFVIDPGGAARQFASGQNLPFGLDPSSPVLDEETLAPGALLLIYTDGMIEQPDDAGACLGVAGLKHALREICSAATADRPRAVAARLEELLTRRQAGRPREDDQSFVVVGNC